MHLSSNEIIVFLISLSIILFFARAIGELLRLIKQPIVIGEIIAGIILGPTIFGTLFPGVYNYLFVQSKSVSIALNGITSLGIIMLLLITGIEIDISLMIKQGKKSLLISLLGIFIPLITGFIASYLFPEFFGLRDSAMHLIYSIFIGISLSLTALPIVARTLMELNIFKSELGLSIITSAMMIDLIGWLMFSLLIGLLGKAHSANFYFYELIIILLLFTFVVFLFFRKLFDNILAFSKKYLSNPGGILNVVFILGFLGAAFTEYIGIHAIYGAFIVGIALGDSGHLSENIREMINQFVTNIFAPLFFVTIGLKINFIQHFDPLLVTIFIVLACLSKTIGAFSGAYISGFNKNNSLIIAFGLNTHGTIELLVGTVAYELGLINEKIFVVLVVMAILTTLSSAPLMGWFVKKSQTIVKLSSLLKANNVIFSTSKNKYDIIEELCRNISYNNEISYEKLFYAVIERENQISTGLENYLAIPHARLNINHPAAAIAINRDGIDFKSHDNLPAKLIILLITPENKPELQLELLSEIAHKFGNKEIIENIISSSNEKEIISKIKQLY